MTMNNKSMWFNLRTQYSKYTQSDVAEIYGCSRQAISCFEQGKSKMPIKLQILYLGFRNNEQDQWNIKYLKSIINQ